MPALSSFDYAIVCVVPRPERGEFINVGVILFCRTRRFLEARIELDRQRLHALAPDCDPDLLQSHLDLIPQICAGNLEAGPIARLPRPDRFHWLVAPRSTVIQVSPVHSGLCEDPSRELERLMETMVRLPQQETPGVASEQTKRAD